MKLARHQTMAWAFNQRQMLRLNMVRSFVLLLCEYQMFLTVLQTTQILPCNEHGALFEHWNGNSVGLVWLRSNSAGASCDAIPKGRRISNSKFQLDTMRQTERWTMCVCIWSPAHFYCTNPREIVGFLSSEMKTKHQQQLNPAQTDPNRTNTFNSIQLILNNLHTFQEYKKQRSAQRLPFHCSARTMALVNGAVRFV